MSHFEKIDLQFMDREALVATLADRYGIENVEVHDSPVSIGGGYDQNTMPDCHIVVRKETLRKKGEAGAYNDAGFKIETDGTITPYVDGDWWNRYGDPVRQSYTERVTMKNVPRGYKASRYVEADGTIKITLEQKVW